MRIVEAATLTVGGMTVPITNLSYEIDRLAREPMTVLPASFECSFATTLLDGGYAFLAFGQKLREEPARVQPHSRGMRVRGRRRRARAEARRLAGMLVLSVGSERVPATELYLDVPGYDTVPRFVRRRP